MKSKAAIGSHPIHPMLVPIPIGAFFLALFGDVMRMATPEDRFWYDFSYTCIGLGIAFAVLAAIVGAIDYVGVKMSGPAFRVATAHALVNVAMVVSYVLSFLLRRHDAALSGGRWPGAFFFAVLGFGLLCVSGWLGGKLAHEHRVGVVEAPAAEAAVRRERAAS
jgi:uncharacterized membrane protein